MIFVNEKILSVRFLGLLPKCWKYSCFTITKGSFIRRWWKCYDLIHALSKNSNHSASTRRTNLTLLLSEGPLVKYLMRWLPLSKPQCKNQLADQNNKYISTLWVIREHFLRKSKSWKFYNIDQNIIPYKTVTCSSTCIYWNVLILHTRLL